MYHRIKSHAITAIAFFAIGNFTYHGLVMQNFKNRDPRTLEFVMSFYKDTRETPAK